MALVTYLRITALTAAPPAAIITALLVFTVRYALYALIVLAFEPWLAVSTEPIAAVRPAVLAITVRYALPAPTALGLAFPDALIVPACKTARWVLFAHTLFTGTVRTTGCNGELASVLVHTVAVVAALH